MKAFTPPLPKASLPPLPTYADSFTFESDPDPLDRLVTENPEIEAKTDFVGTRRLEYSLQDHGPLQAVLDELEPFALVEIPAGEYRLDLHLHKAVYLQASGTVTITGAGRADVITCDAEFVVLDGLTIRQGNSRRGGAVFVASGFTSLINCQISSGALSAVFLSGTAAADLYDCELSKSFNPVLHLTENSIARCLESTICDGKTYGVVVDGDASLSISGSTVCGCAASGIATNGRANLHVSESEITQNRITGLDLSSTGHLHIEYSKVTDHAQGTGLLCRGGAAAMILESSFSNAKFGLVRASEGGVVKSSLNVFKDCQSSGMIVAERRGFVQSENDTFEGSCQAAIAASSLGVVRASQVQLESLGGGLALAIGRGKVCLEDTSVIGLTNFGVEAKDDSVLELVGVTLSEVAGPCVAGRKAHGFVRDCRFSKSSVGCEFWNCECIDVSGCEFGDHEAVGLVVRGSNVTCTDSQFRGGQAGCVITDGSLTLVGSRFEGSSLAALSVLGGLCHIRKATILSAGQFGLTVSCGQLVGEQVEVSSASIGVGVFAGGELTIFEGKVQSAQVESGGAKARFVNGRLTHGIVALNNALVQCEGCHLEDAAQPHCEIRQGAIVHLQGCDVGPSRSGVGLQVHRAGELRLDGGRVHDAAKFGVVVGEGGGLKAAQAAIAGCGIGGVYAADDAKVECHATNLEANGQIGLQVQGGDVKINDCLISGHEYGVVVGEAATFAEAATKYENNKKKDISDG
jgi:nitrous oxidase accessory protein NosD